MSSSVIHKVTADAAARDARLAAAEYDNALVWLRAMPKLSVPLAAEVWVTDTARTAVLLVRHRVRGWVPPGGTVENGEVPRAAMARELHEETGVGVGLSKRASGRCCQVVPCRLVTDIEPVLRRCHQP